MPTMAPAGLSRERYWHPRFNPRVVVQLDACPSPNPALMSPMPACIPYVRRHGFAAPALPNPQIYHAPARQPSSPDDTAPTTPAYQKPIDTTFPSPHHQPSPSKYPAPAPAYHPARNSIQPVSLPSSPENPLLRPPNKPRQATDQRPPKPHAQARLQRGPRWAAGSREDRQASPDQPSPPAVTAQSAIHCGAPCPGGEALGRPTALHRPCPADHPPRQERARSDTRTGRNDRPIQLASAATPAEESKNRLGFPAAALPAGAPSGPHTHYRGPLLALPGHVWGR